MQLPIDILMVVNYWMVRCSCWCVLNYLTRSCYLI